MWLLTKYEGPRSLWVTCYLSNSFKNNFTAMHQFVSDIDSTCACVCIYVYSGKG